MCEGDIEREGEGMMNSMEMSNLLSGSAIERGRREGREGLEG